MKKLSQWLKRLMPHKLKRNFYIDNAALIKAIRDAS